jgi:hypothetical protein
MWAVSLSFSGQRCHARFERMRCALRPRGTAHDTTLQRVCACVCACVQADVERTDAVAGCAPSELRPGADRVDEAGDACGGECAEECVQWPGRVEVGGLLLECGSDGLAVEVVEFEQEVVGVDRFDADRLACLGREAV